MEAPKYGSKEHIAINRQRITSLIKYSKSEENDPWERFRASSIALSLTLWNLDLITKFTLRFFKKLPKGGITCPETDCGESIVNVKNIAKKL